MTPRRTFHPVPAKETDLASRFSSNFPLRNLVASRLAPLLVRREMNINNRSPNPLALPPHYLDSTNVVRTNEQRTTNTGGKRIFFM